jgi:predicted short-subunit dehydrogenase-like oxidoreductase (DUF2520 family)
LPSSITTSHPLHLAVLGTGRLGTALAAALTGVGVDVAGPYGRGRYPDAEATRPDLVLLCVPDAEIARAAAQFPEDQLLGHCSGAGELQLLGSHAGFSLHPLTTITAAGADFRGVGAAIDATGPEAHLLAHTLAAALGMRPFHVTPEDRVAYHAAASMASNFLVTLGAAAERLAATTGLDRELLVPLVRASVENWAVLGPERALTGPVARGDEDTVARQRAAVSERTPELLALFEAMVTATGDLAATRAGQLS